MNDYTRSRAGAVPVGRADMAVDAGLRSFMLGVYNKMALGLVLSAVLAYASVSIEPVRQLIFGTPLVYVVLFAPLALILVSSFAMRNPSPTGATMLYWSFVSVSGLGLGLTLMIYGGSPSGMIDVAKAFLITAAAFGGLSLWGYTTKKDISGWGSFLIMGMFGLVIASLVQFGFAAFNGGQGFGSAFSFVFSVIGVLIFSGITAWETQQLKYQYTQLAGDARSLAIATTYGALNLYITFVNLFRMILSLISSRN